MTTIKRTPLFDTHVALGGKMVDFAGWEMPIQYQGIKAEHEAVRQHSGLFDVSHMGEIRVTGTGAEAFLNYACLNDATKLKIGRAHYSMIANDSGGLIDDIYLYREAEDNFLVVCNASNRAAVVPHLQTLATDYAVTVHDESDDWALIALQGPEAQIQLEKVCSKELTDLKKNRYIDVDYASSNIRIAKTGYTGEKIGYEIFVRPSNATQLWNALIEAGTTPCGLGARDTLRLEAGFPLFGHEFDATTNPLCSDYAWVVKDKNFYGREALYEKMEQTRCFQRLVGIELIHKGIAREGYIVKTLIKTDNTGLGLSLDLATMTTGKITSGTMSPTLGKAIAMAWVDKADAEIGTELLVEVRNKDIAAKVVEMPFK